MNNHIVESSHEGLRLDAYASEISGISRSKIVTMIKEDKVLVNGESAKASYKLVLNDEVFIDEYQEKPINLEPVEMDLDIIYEDDDVIVINKPRGLVVHPGAGTNEPTLVNGLLYHTSKLSLSDDPVRPGIVHRLDKDTSGLLVVAKNDHAHQALAAQLQDRTMGREYVALVHGVFTHMKAKVDAPIGRDANQRQKMCVTSKNSKQAVTHLTLLESFKEYTLLQCKLDTGRTHQIRVHLQYIGFPIVGDPLYSFKNTPDFGGQLLHAKKIVFKHPTTHQLMTFQCDVPAIFEEFLQELRRD